MDHKEEVMKVRDILANLPERTIEDGSCINLDMKVCDSKIYKQTGQGPTVTPSSQTNLRDTGAVLGRLPSSSLD